MWNRLFELVHFVEECLLSDWIDRLKTQPAFPEQLDAIVYETYNPENDTFTITSYDENLDAEYPSGEYVFSFHDYALKRITQSLPKLGILRYSDFNGYSDSENSNNLQKFKLYHKRIKTRIKGKSISPSAVPYSELLFSAIDQPCSQIKTWFDRSPKTTNNGEQTQAKLPKPRSVDLEIQSTLDANSIRQSSEQMAKILVKGRFIKEGKRSVTSLVQFLEGEPANTKIVWKGYLMELKFFINELAKRSEFIRIPASKWKVTCDYFQKETGAISVKNLNTNAIPSSARARLLTIAAECLKEYPKISNN